MSLKIIIRDTLMQNPSYNQEDLNTVESSSVSVSQASSALHNMSLGSSRTSTNDSLQVIDENGSFIVADENTWHWRETILDNVHRLPNLTFQSHKISEAVKLEVHFTKDVCELGKKPELIDPYIYEYKQGDLLNGYILIKTRLKSLFHLKCSICCSKVTLWLQTHWMLKIRYQLKFVSF